MSKRAIRTLSEKIKLIENAIESKAEGRSYVSFALENGINAKQLSHWIIEYKSGLFGKIKKPVTRRMSGDQIPTDLFRELSDNFNNPDESDQELSEKHEVTVYMYEGEKELFTIPVMIPADLSVSEAEDLIRTEIQSVLTYRVTVFPGESE